MQHDQEFYISVVVKGFFWMAGIVILFLIAWIYRLRKESKKKEIEKEFMKTQRVNGKEKVHE